jgi:hypothetical protein
MLDSTMTKFNKKNADFTQISQPKMPSLGTGMRNRWAKEAKTSLGYSNSSG